MTTDVHAITEYEDAVADLLKEQKFSQLDCLADAARSTKSRFPGGAWKLRKIYVGLESPRPGHPTEDDWKEHLKLIENWREQVPNSVTAPIALADSYVSYAWDARGTSSADGVSESGWNLFAARLAKAKSILDQVAEPGIKCPQWFITMQNVAMGQSWQPMQARALFDRAVAFEPDYQYFYRAYATYLLPKWDGEEGDAARFAEEFANRLGGDAGDLLYFEIADGNLCACEDTEFSHFSWPRLQKGFAALEKRYGASLGTTNSYALMAAKSDDWITADMALKRMGDNWDKDVWLTEAWFKHNKAMATAYAPMQARNLQAKKEAEANMQTPEGQAYRKKVQETLSTFAQPCVEQTKDSVEKFAAFVRMGEHGSADDVRGDKAPNSLGLCLWRALYVSHANNQTPFPPPPRAAYWVPIEVDPAAFAAATK